MRKFIIIPAYNEEGRISATLDDIRASVLKKYGDVTVIVVSEGHDKTNEIVKSYAKKDKRIRLLTKKERQGKGGGIIIGFREALKTAKGGDIVGFVDADGATSGRELVKLIAHIANGNSDAAIGSRHISGSVILGKKSYARFIASRAYNAYVRSLFGFHYKDTQCGAKFMLAGKLARIVDKLTVTDFSFDINLLYELRRIKAKVDEVPIRYTPKDQGTKINVREQMAKMFASTLDYRLKTLR